MKCPKCGANVPAGAKICGNCGVPLTAGRRCPHCKAPLPPMARVCPKCSRAVFVPPAPKPAQVKAPAPQKDLPPVPPKPNAPKKPLTKRWWFWAACVLLTLGIIGNIGNGLSGRENKGKGSGRATTPPSAVATASPTASPIPTQSPTPTIAPTATPSPTPTPTPSPTAVPETDNVFLLAPVKIGAVMNGIKTEKLGEYASIEIKKADAKSASADDFKQFVDTRISQSGYNWWSIIFEDGTAIVFPASQAISANYGAVDYEGTITTVYGDIILDTNGASYAYHARADAPEESIHQSTITEKPESNGGATNNFETYDNPGQQQTTASYVLNTSSMKIHYPTCRSVKKIAPKNYAEFSGTVEEAEGQGYSRCGICF